MFVMTDTSQKYYKPRIRINKHRNVAPAWAGAVPWLASAETGSGWAGAASVGAGSGRGESGHHVQMGYWNPNLEN